MSARAVRLALAALVGVGLAAARAGAQEPAAPALRAIPARGLVGLVEFDGVGPHAEAWRRTAAARMFQETTAGAMVTAVLDQVVGRAADEPGAGPAGARWLTEHVLEHGLAAGLASAEPGGKRPFAVAVLPAAGGAAVRPRIEAMLLPAPRPTTTLERQGRQLTILATPGPGRLRALWTEGDDLIGFEGDEADLAIVLATLRDGGSAAEHPNRRALRQPIEGGETVALAFLDLEHALPPLPEEARTLGLDGLKRIEVRLGFAGAAIATDWRFVAPAPRRGLLALIDQPALTADALPPLAPETTSFAFVALDPLRVFDRLAAVPGPGEALRGLERVCAQVSGLDLRTEVLATLGPRWAFYQQPSNRVGAAPMGNNPLGALMFDPPRLTVTVQTRDPKAFAGAAGTLFGVLNRVLRQEMRQAPGPARVLPYAEGPVRGFTLEVPPQVLPLPPAVRPALILGASDAALSLSPELAQAALDGSAPAEVRQAVAAAGDGLIAFVRSDPRPAMPELIANVPFFLQVLGQAQGPQAQGWQRRLAAVRIDRKLVPKPDDLRPYLFPNDLTLSVDDAGLRLRTRDSLPSLMPGSEASGGVMIALLLPAVQAAREAARRAQCINNLKQIGLALHNYHQAHDRLPAAAIADKDGMPLLSWRVAILPYIEQQALYDEFHLDEPWDSAHNRALVARMPATYACPSGSLPAGQTPYRGFVGGGALFDRTEGTRFAAVTDGLSNTLMVAEGDGVPWTRPDDPNFDPDADPPGATVGSRHPGGFNALLADGSVRFFKLPLPAAFLRALITRAGGEVIDWPNP